ncbi:MAG TPA: hypothetical protein V6D17_17260, partial [Candidatus Obscuribacterales bacterium]
PSARGFAPRFFQTSPRGCVLALRYTSSSSDCEWTFTSKLLNMPGTPKNMDAGGASMFGGSFSEKRLEKHFPALVGTEQAKNCEG